MKIEKIKKEHKEWRSLRYKVSSLQAEIASIAESISVVVVGKPVGYSDRTATLAIRLEELKQSYTTQLEQAVQLQNKYNDALASLTPQEYEIVWAYLINNEPLTKVSQKVNYSPAHVSARLIPKILEKLAKILGE